ncbi:MAG: nuclear transport factor 2 family protein [Longimicrobiales bacterium]
MRRSILALFAIALVTPQGAWAQQWTPEEQGLIDNIKMCWDAWMEAVEAMDVEIHYRKCPQVDDVSMWWTDFGAPEGKQMARRNFGQIAAVDLAWLDIRPVAVRIWGDVGMVQFYGYWSARTPGRPVVTEFKRTEVFRRVDGQWVFLGGQGTPASAADGAPYK